MLSAVVRQPFPSRRANVIMLVGGLGGFLGKALLDHNPELYRSTPMLLASVLGLVLFVGMLVREALRKIGELELNEETLRLTYWDGVEERLIDLRQPFGLDVRRVSAADGRPPSVVVTVQQGATAICFGFGTDYTGEDLDIELGPVPANTIWAARRARSIYEHLLTLRHEVPVDGEREGSDSPREAWTA